MRKPRIILRVSIIDNRDGRIYASPIDEFDRDVFKRTLIQIAGPKCPPYEMQLR